MPRTINRIDARLLHISKNRMVDLSRVTPDRLIASLEASAANSIALTSENAPVYRAIGVRAPATITTSVGNMSASVLQVIRRIPVLPILDRRLSVTEHLHPPRHKSKCMVFLKLHHTRLRHNFHVHVLDVN